VLELKSFALLVMEALVREPYFGTGILFCLCDRDEEEVTGDDGGGVKIGEVCCNEGKIGVVDASASPK
jgi:hypothetical protein